MTTAQSLVTDAYREGNILAVGATPSTAQLTEGLERLNRMINYTFGYGIGENLHDWLAPQPQRTTALNADYPLTAGPDDLTNDQYINPPPNSRIVWGGTTLTVWFPQNPSDGSRMGLVQGSGVRTLGAAGDVLTLDGNGRLIEGADTKTIVNPLTAPLQWLYRADTGSWTAVKDMALTDDCPFPPDFDDLWIGQLFVRLAPRYGKTVTPETAAMIKTATTSLRARYAQAISEGSNAEHIPNTVQSYGWYR